jgi:hypothetical protein
VECGSARKCRRKFLPKFPGNIAPSITCIQKLINKARSAGSLLDKEPAKKFCALTERNLDETGSSLKHTTQKSLRRLAGEAGISKS